MESVADLIETGLWPSSKKFPGDLKPAGEFELHDLGYELFYIGKNADMYFKPGNTSVLMVRTDRTSVNDILLSDVIEGKGLIQNQISNLGYDFAEKMGISTARLSMPTDISVEIALRSQYIQLSKALSITLDNNIETGLELIYRNYLTGSLYKHYTKGNDPYSLNLSEGLKEWNKFEVPIFTPTTKGVSDDPLDYKIVQNLYSDIYEQLLQLLIAYTKYAEDRGIVLVDTKFEMFDDMLGDEILTPESSRFILKSDFEQGIYKSMDKQILRDYANEQGWIEKGIKGEVLDVTIPKDIKGKVLAGYQKVYDMLAA